GFSEERAQELYERYAIPAPGGIVWDNVLANIKPGHQAAWVDYRNEERAPLLFISGSDDHIMPPAGQRSNAKHSQAARPITEIREYPGPHLLPAADNWVEVADDALEWALAHARMTPPAPAGEAA